MQRPISRRDFVNGILVGSGAALLSSPAPALGVSHAAPDLTPSGSAGTGYGGVGDYRWSNGNTEVVRDAAHGIRDHLYPDLDLPIKETYDVVIVGGGFSGLTVGYEFSKQRKPGQTCLILDNHPIFGGEAKQNEFQVDGHRLVAHQGSAIYLVPYPHSFIARFYDSIGLHTPKLSYQKWSGPQPAMAISRTPYDSAGLSR